MTHKLQDTHSFIQQSLDLPGKRDFQSDLNYNVNRGICFQSSRYCLDSAEARNEKGPYKTFKSIQIYGAKNINLKIRFKRDAVKTLGLR